MMLLFLKEEEEEGEEKNIISFMGRYRADHIDLVEAEF